MNMKTTYPLFLILTAAALALTGCSKPSTPASAIAGPMAKAANLQKAFPAAGPGLKASLDKIASDIRYGEYPAVLAELEKVAVDPSLTDDQKKAVSDTTEEVKKAMTSVAPKTTP